MVPARVFLVQRKDGTLSAYDWLHHLNVAQDDPIMAAELDRAWFVSALVVLASPRHAALLRVLRARRREQLCRAADVTRLDHRGPPDITAPGPVTAPTATVVLTNRPN